MKKGSGETSEKKFLAKLEVIVFLFGLAYWSNYFFFRENITRNEMGCPMPE